MLGWIKSLRRAKKIRLLADHANDAFFSQPLRSAPIAPHIETDSIRGLVEASDERIRQIDEKYCRKIAEGALRDIEVARQHLRENANLRHGLNLCARYWTCAATSSGAGRSRSIRDGLSRRWLRFREMSLVVRSLRRSDEDRDAGS